ncbi:MAG TPA: ribbon-helix-helix protein, CopG family [Chloroflexota bacterium]|jgi:hypothetical protein|nr:ribbon-helix-helix protein, CopG family [Chloroflexota bacterium]
MKRTTIMAPKDLLDELQRIADDEQLSLAEIIRQALRMRVSPNRRRLTFVGSGDSTTAPTDMARRSADLKFDPPPWR